ncbi:MAG: RHS repeat-associated core domain-containing protein [Gemmatimonadota bacterium]
MSKKRRSMTVGHPIDVASGSVYTQQPDIFVSSRRPLELARFYDTGNGDVGAFGLGWTFTYGATLREDLEGFRFTNEMGIEHVVDDPFTSGRQRVLDPGSLLELDLDVDRCLVTQWDALDPTASRYQFVRSENGRDWLLLRMQMATGRWFDLEWSRGAVEAVVDRRSGRRLRFDYGADGLVQAVWAHAGNGYRRRVARYGYDERCRLVWAADAGGAECGYEYDAMDRLIRESTRDGEVYEFRYDEGGRCVATSGTLGYDAQELVYHEAEHRTEVTDSRGGRWVYEFNEAGQTRLLTSPLGHVRAFAYDEHGRLSSLTDPNGNVTVYRFGTNGHCSAIVDPTGAAEEFTYSADHCLVGYTDRTGSVWTWSYDDQFRVTRHLEPSGATWSYEYDGRGDLVEMSNPLGARRELRYSMEGDLVSVRDFGSEVRTFEYDAEGALVAETDGAGGRTVIDRDPYGNPAAITVGDVPVCRLRFDSQRNVTERIDSAGSRWAYSYASGGRLTEIRKPDGGVTRFTWTTLPGRLGEIVNEAGESYTIDYDPDGRPERTKDFDGEERRFRHDPAGNLVVVETAAGPIEYGRDATGRVVREAHPDGEEVAYAYDAAGRLVRAAGPDATVAYGLDAAGRIVREQVNDRWVEYARDVAGNLLRLETSLGYAAEYALDPAARPREIALRGTRPSRPYHTASVEYDPTGRPREYRLPNGAVARWTRDEASRPRALHVLRGAAEVLSISYTWSGMDRVESRQGSDGRSARFSYDAAGRLVGMSDSGGREQTRVYDRAGRLALDRSGERSGDTHSGAPQTRYTFDAAGRVTRREAGGTVQEYRWSSAGRLLEVAGGADGPVRYKYDPLGRRIAKEVGGEVTEFVWDGDRVIHEVAPRESPVTWMFLPDTFTPLARVQDGKCLDIASDFLGTPLAAVGDGGRTEWAGEPDAFGKFAIAGDQGSCRWRWPGQYDDPETGLHYNRFRYYDPASGWYLSKDPLGLTGGIDPWAYPANPLCWMDPLGLIALIQAPFDANPLSEGYRSFVRGLSAPELAAVGGRNIAVAQLNDGRVVGAISQGPGRHSERLLVEQHGAANIAAMYTERSPCTGRDDCHGLMEGRVGADVPVYYTHEMVRGQEGKTAQAIKQQRRQCRT